MLFHVGGLHVAAEVATINLSLFAFTAPCSRRHLANSNSPKKNPRLPAGVLVVPGANPDSSLTDLDRTMTTANVHDCANQRNEIDLLRARGRLSDAKEWFAHREWSVLPQSDRGRTILEWGADHAYLASPDNPMRSVRNWCRRWAPWLKDAELARLVARTASSNMRWSDGLDIAQCPAKTNRPFQT
jgi:hypothetical protein